MAKKPLIHHASLSETIYDVLKDQIINEESRPRERLLDGRLASSFGVSRTPVSTLLEKANGPGKESFKAHIDSDVNPHDSILKNCYNRRLTSIMANLYTLIHVFRMRMTKNGKKQNKL